MWVIELEMRILVGIIREFLIIRRRVERRKVWVERRKKKMSRRGSRIIRNILIYKNIILIIYIYILYIYLLLA